MVVLSVLSGLNKRRGVSPRPRSDLCDSKFLAAMGLGHARTLELRGPTFRPPSPTPPASCRRTVVRNVGSSPCDPRPPPPAHDSAKGRGPGQRGACDPHPEPSRGVEGLQDWGCRWRLLTQRRNPVPPGSLSLWRREAGKGEREGRAEGGDPQAAAGRRRVGRRPEGPGR